MKKQSRPVIGTMFKIGWNDIEVVDYVHATPHFVTYLYSWSNDQKARSERKEARAGSFFATWEEARTYLRDKAAARLESAIDAVNNYSKRLAEIDAMKETT